MLAEISDAVWLAIIGLIAMAVKELFDRQRGKDAAAKVEETAVRLEKSNIKTAEKLEEIAKVGEATHDLSNSAMGEQKQMLAATARAKANLSQDPVDIAAAEVAEAHYRDHLAKQAKVDSKKDQPAQSLAEMQQAYRTPGYAPAAPDTKQIGVAAAVAELKKDIAKVPKKTADKVIEHIESEKEA